jgi:hypothetical protein
MNNFKKSEVKRSYSNIITAFAEENFNLKVLSALLLATTIIALVAILILIKRGPKVMALDSSGSIAILETKITDRQIEAMAKEYLKYRYCWSPVDIGDALKKAKFFVMPQLVPAFERSMISVKKFVTEKKVTQRIYPRSVKVDSNSKTISIVSDRFTEFDQLKAATEMKLTLEFALGERTVINPWGIFITKETEETSQ